MKMLLLHIILIAMTTHNSYGHLPSYHKFRNKIYFEDHCIHLCMGPALSKYLINTANEQMDKQKPSVKLYFNRS